MAYVTQQEIIDTYGWVAVCNLTDRAEPPLGQIDEAILQRAIDAATELIDGYLAKRYQLPLQQVPVDLQEHARALVFFNLHRGRHEVITENLRQLRDDAIKWLSDVEKGVVILNAPTPQQHTAGSAPIFDAPTRTFGFDSLREFR